MQSKGMWKDRNPSLGLSWFHSKSCLVSSSQHPVVRRMRYFTSAGDGQLAVDVMCPGALFLCSVALAARHRRGLLLLGFWAGLSCCSVS